MTSPPWWRCLPDWVLRSCENTRQSCSGVFLWISGLRWYISRPCRVRKNSRSEGFTTTCPVSCRSRNSRRLRMKISYGVSGIVPRSRSRVRSISAMCRSSLGGGRAVVGRLLELMEAAAAVDAGGGKQIGLDRQKDRRLRVIVVEVLHHDAVALARQAHDIADLPAVLDAVEHGVAAPGHDVEDLRALKLE